MTTRGLMSAPAPCKHRKERSSRPRLRLVGVETPLWTGGGAVRQGVLRLRESLASRDSCSAQDDTGERSVATRLIVASSLRSGMRLVVDVHHVLDRELGVALRGRQPLMAEQFLDGAQVRSLFQHVGAEGVTESMRMNFWRQSFGNGDTLDNASDAAGGEASAALVD